MTCNELKAEIDSLLGIESQLVEKVHDSELHYFSPTGVLLFIITVFPAWDAEAWRIGGYPGGVLPDRWDFLMRLQQSLPRKENNNEQ